MAFGRHYHPIWTMAASVALVACGVLLLLVGFPILAFALALYGAGNGIGSIAKGTLPLGLFGPDGYATLMGKLAMPSLLAQALSPSLGAILIEWSGPGRRAQLPRGDDLPEHRPRGAAVGDRPKGLIPRRPETPCGISRPPRRPDARSGGVPGQAPAVLP